MSISKPKTVTSRAAKTSVRRARPALAKAGGMAGSFAQETATIRNGKVVVGASSSAPASALQRVGNLVKVNIGEARAAMPNMVRKSSEGMTFLIANARRGDDAGALLMSAQTFLRAIPERESERTLDDVLAKLPFSGVELPRLAARTLPGAGRSKARLPE